MKYSAMALTVKVAAKKVVVKFPAPIYREENSRHQAFTIIEVLLALVVMTVLISVAWPSVIALLKTRQKIKQHQEKTITMETGASQFYLQKTINAWIEPLSNGWFKYRPQPIKEP